MFPVVIDWFCLFGVAGSWVSVLVIQRLAAAAAVITVDDVIL